MILGRARIPAGTGPPPFCVSYFGDQLPRPLPLGQMGWMAVAGIGGGASPWICASVGTDAVTGAWARKCGRMRAFVACSKP